MNEDISIKFDASAIKADAFIRVVSSFFKIARNVSDGAARESKVDWLVSVEKGSAIVTGHPKVQKGDPAIGRGIVNFMWIGFQSVGSGYYHRPQFFNDEALDGLRTIGAIKASRPDIGDIEIVSNGNRIPITGDIVRTVDAILGTVHKSFGEIEGKLCVLSDQGGFKFTLLEPIHGLDVTCYITDDALIERAVNAFRKRICAEGLIKYRPNGTPLSIDVSDFKEFDDSSNYPSVDDIIGIYKRE